VVRTGGDKVLVTFGEVSKYPNVRNLLACVLVAYCVDSFSTVISKRREEETLSLWLVLNRRVFFHGP